MFKKKKKKQEEGVTFIELMVAIAIIAIVSSVFVFYIKGTDREKVERVTEQIAADARYVRNLATSRTTYDFGDGAGEVFPPGGYGIEFVDYDNGSPAEYYIFADKDQDGGDIGNFPNDYDEGIDGLLKHVVLEEDYLRLDDYGLAHPYFYFTFLEENKVKTNMAYNAVSGKYYMTVLDPGPGYPAKGYKGTVNLGERSADVSESPGDYSYVWGSIGYYYSVYNPPDPDPDGGGSKVDPVQTTSGF